MPAISTKAISVLLDTDIGSDIDGAVCGFEKGRIEVALKNDHHCGATLGMEWERIAATTGRPMAHCCPLESAE